MTGSEGAALCGQNYRAEAGFPKSCPIACPTVNEAEMKKASLDKDFSPEPLSPEPMAVLQLAAGQNRSAAGGKNPLLVI
jgi:hypothetical protein